jgi:hypothetical protein
MYFYDLNDYIATAQSAYPSWYNDSILFGAMGSIGGWRGILGGDFEDYFGTARETGNAYLKALNQYLLTCRAITNYELEPEDAAISKLYFNDFQDAIQRHDETIEPYHNAIMATKRRYEVQVIFGYTGTYDDWLFNEINKVNPNVSTGTTTSSESRLIYDPNESSGQSAIPVTYTINYGSFEEIKNVDKYYNEFKASMDDLMRIMKTAMVLTDNDEFEDLEPEITPLSSDCDVEYRTPPAYINFRNLDLMDDLNNMPSGSDIDLLYYTANTCDYSSIQTLDPDNGPNGGDFSNNSTAYRMYCTQQEAKINAIIDGMYLGFDKSYYPSVDYNQPIQPISNLSKYYSTNTMRRIKYTWWSKASDYIEWSTVNYPTYGAPLSSLLNGVTDVKYLAAVPTVSHLPYITGKAGDLIMVGTPSSHVGYAWDPFDGNWSDVLHDFIDGQIFEQRRLQKNASMLSKKNMVLSIKPMLWSNEYLFSDGIRNWQLSDVSANTVNTIAEIIATNGANLPPKYSITASTYALSGFNATTIIY